MLNKDPPHGVGTDAIHPCALRSLRNRIVQAFPDNGLIAEYRENRLDLRMQISDPHQPVPLDAVPDVMLHAKMNRVGSHIPDAAELGIAAPERPQIGNVPVDQYSINILQAYGYTGCQQIDPDKPEAGLPYRIHAQPLYRYNHIPAGMIICGIGFPARFAHGFRHRFTEPDAKLCLLATVYRKNGKQQATMMLLAEIQQNGCIFSPVIQGTAVFHIQGDLNGAVFQQHFAAGYILRLPDYPRGQKKQPFSVVFPCTVRKGQSVQHRCVLFHPGIPSHTVFGFSILLPGRYVKCFVFHCTFTRLPKNGILV